MIASARDPPRALGRRPHEVVFVLDMAALLAS